MQSHRRRREGHGVVPALQRRHPAVVLRGREDACSITLEQLFVPSGSRGRGLGSALMRDLVAYADRHAKQIRLTPSGAFGGSPRRLATFYARFGFVRNQGAQRDPACAESMYRNPITAPRPPRRASALPARTGLGARDRLSEDDPV